MWAAGAATVPGGNVKRKPKRGEAMEKQASDDTELGSYVIQWRIVNKHRTYDLHGELAVLMVAS